MFLLHEHKGESNDSNSSIITFGEVLFAESGTTTEWFVPEEAHGVGEVASRGGTVRTCEDYGGSVATRIRELAVRDRTIDEHR